MSESTGYPRHWEADVLLRDGQAAHLRPIHPEDRDLLVEFYEQVSAESKYLRFFAPMPHLSERDIKRFTEVGNTGAYLSVVQPGTVRRGDAVEVLSRPDHDIDVRVAFRAFTGDLDAAERVLAARVLNPVDHADLQATYDRRTRDRQAG